MVKRIWTAIHNFWKVLDQGNTIGLAAEIAFFLLLSFFPLALFAADSLAHLNVKNNTAVLDMIFPEEIFALVSNTPAAPPPQETLPSPVLFIGSVWAASAGIWALMRGVHYAYTDKRLVSVKARLLALVFTLGLVGMIAGTLTLLAFGWWLALFGSLLILFLGLFALYTLIPGLYAIPGRAAAAALTGAAGWLTLARAYELYLRTISNYTLLYGGIGAFLGLALWLFCLCILILVCAEWSALKVRTPAKREDSRSKP